MFTVRAAVRHKSYTFSLAATRGDTTACAEVTFWRQMLRCLPLCLVEHTQGKSRFPGRWDGVWFSCKINPIDHQYEVLDILNWQNLSKENVVYLKYLVPNPPQVRSQMSQDPAWIPASKLILKIEVQNQIKNHQQ